MKLTVLGAGTMVPEKGYSPSAYLLEAGEKKMLLDCGWLSLSALTALGISANDISEVFITHFHTDHFGGLMPLIHARFVAELVYGEKSAPLRVYGPSGITQKMRQLKDIFWPEEDQSYDYGIHEGPGKWTLDGVRAVSFKVEHTRWSPSVGYRIEHGGAAVAYTGDSAPKQDRKFIGNLKGADLLIMEAAAATEEAGSHITAKRAVEWAIEAKAAKLLLSHTGKISRALAEEAAASAAFPVLVAKDLETLTINE